VGTTHMTTHFVNVTTLREFVERNDTLRELTSIDTICDDYDDDERDEFIVDFMTSCSTLFDEFLMQRGLHYDDVNNRIMYDDEKFDEIDAMCVDIAHDYENDDERGTWKRFELRGDDDVDYNSSYVSIMIEILRAYHATQN
jgi:hypothetical protein